jgi:uncharacterized membrane protein
MLLKRSSRTLLQAAVLSAVVTAALTAASKDVKSAKGKEKCYGVAKAGENGCQATSGSHTCGGCSSVDYHGENWMWVPAGRCLNLGGQLLPFDGFGKQAAAPSGPKASLP